MLTTFPKCQTHLNNKVDDKHWYQNWEEYWCTVANQDKSWNHGCHLEEEKPSVHGDIHIQFVHICRETINNTAKWGGVEEGHGCPKDSMKETAVHHSSSYYSTHQNS